MMLILFDHGVYNSFKLLVFKTIETFHLVRYTGSHCQPLDWLQGYCIIQKFSTDNVINKISFKLFTL